MRKLLGVIGFFALFCLPAKGQVTPSWELGAGYAFRSYYPPTQSRFGMNGWDFTAEHNFRRYLGLAIDAAGTYANQGANGHYSIYELLAGPRFYPLKHRHKIVPYGQFLVGLGYLHLYFPANGAFESLTDHSLKYTFEGGGGVEWRLKPKWNIRVIEFDYEHTHFPSFLPGNTFSYTEGNYRFSAGLVYHIGGK
jgi:Outer membrane protein beta-barrel domain